MTSDSRPANCGVFCQVFGNLNNHFANVQKQIEEAHKQANQAAQAAQDSTNEIDSNPVASDGTIPVNTADDDISNPQGYTNSTFEEKVRLSIS